MGIRTALLIGAIALSATGLIIIALEATRYTQAEGLLHAYQDLIAGVLALSGALIGASYLNRQILTQREQESDRRVRRHAAARAVMPHVLMALGDYARDVVVGLEEARQKELYAIRFEAGNPESSDVAPVELPKLPDALIRDFAAMIEATAEADSIPFVDLLSDLQVQIARINDLNSRSRLSSWSHQFRDRELLLRLWDAVYIHAAASALFAYTRRKSGASPTKPDWAMMESSALNLELFDQAAFSDLMAEMRERDPTPRIVSSLFGRD